MNRTYCVYMHECPNGKRYIGITSRSPESRWNCGHGYDEQFFGKAVKKYGWENISHTVLSYGLTKEEAEEAEKGFIRLFKSNNPKYGYNCTEGGDGCAGRPVTDEQRKFMSETSRKMWQDPKTRERLLKHLAEISDKNRGRKMPREAVQKTIEAHSIPVLQYDKKLNFVNRFSSLNDAARAIGASENTLISRVCKKKSYTAYGFYWRHADEPITEEEKKEILTVKPHPNGKAVRQFSLDGEFVAEYESLHAAERETGFSFKNIWNSVSGLKHTAYGYRWAYAERD